MDPVALILVAAFACLMALNVPIAVCLALAALLACWSLGDFSGPYLVAQRSATGIASFSLLAIPFFILSGVLMGEGGMARRLMDFAAALLGRFRGGLSHVNTATCMLFGAVSGSATAAVSSVGGFMIPEMERKGYGKEFSVAVTTVSATTGLLIPPSNIMIVYAVVAGNVSVGALFLAGIFPGILVGLLIMAACTLLLARPGQQVPAGKAMPLPAIFSSLLRALPTLFLIVLVMGGILGGIFSATEASAVAVLYALLLGFIYKELSWRKLPAIFLAAAKTTSVVMLLVGASQALSWVLAYQGIPESVSRAILNTAGGLVQTLLLINLILLVVGTFMDMTPAVLVFTPIFLPVAAKLGIDPVHFGIILIANLCIGICTPPVGTCLFVGCGVGKTTLAKVLPSLLPLYAAMLAGLLLITFIPGLSLWIPGIFDY
jgi:tripartite ATP-independent transporter DctM subunit